MKTLISWIAAQIEWLKGFLQEENGKGSMKRLVMLMIAITFLNSYGKVMMINEEIVDVPINWALLLAGIIGLNILSNYMDRKNPDLPGKTLKEKFEEMFSSKEKE